MLKSNPVEHTPRRKGLKVNTNFETKPIGKLIVEQAVPAGIGILAMSLNTVVDTIFVGNWIGASGIAAITVVMPIIFFVASIGMAIGIGGSSMISRALGAKDIQKAFDIFGSQVILSVGLSVILTVLGLIFTNPVLGLFGATGSIVAPSKIYYNIVILGAPFLAFTMTGNTVIRAEGKPKFAMVALLLPAFVNIILDYLFINLMGLGMEGAAYATLLSFGSSFLFVVWFFSSNLSDLKILRKCLRLKKHIVKEIAALGSITLARQGVISLLAIVLNNTLVSYGSELSLAVYGIISRMLMFSLFPVMGIAQGFMPIAGFNYGANNFGRLKESLKKSMLYASGLGILVFSIIMLFPIQIVRVFTDDAMVLKETPDALRMVFAITPLIAIQLIGSSYFQAIGKVRPALFLTLSKQGFFLIPLILILPQFIGILGVWISFPIADLLATIITSVFLYKDVKRYL
ncbi:MATE family efflux transporter [Flavobacteriaceae bacterium F08102]|nr:MATE family efflux transporter [Flavobacteriaceae bacterium F08102]